MDLVIDVGNSETVVGLVDESPLSVIESWRFSTTVPRTADELRLLLRALLEDAGQSSSALTRSVICSVVPSVTEPLSRALEALTAKPPLTLAGDRRLPIELDVDEPKTVGADRIANTLAAKELFARDTVAVDLGTATTFDCITADGVFVGGVISQGIQAGIEWLGRRTAKLPSVELAPPETVIGRRTEDCMRSGAFYSAVEAVDGIVRRILEEWGREDPLVVATGGYAEAIGSRCASVQKIEPYLTLYGIALAGRHLQG